MGFDKSTAQSYCKPRSNSVVRAAGQYQSKEKARRFASSVPGTGTDRREKRCLRKALAFLRLPSGSSVLDIPCGAGRIFPLLKQYGYSATGADISASMIEEAGRADYDELQVASIFETGFADKEFDLVISHRLFQYFSEADDRRSALAELHRISKGPVIVSFSCNLAIDVAAYKFRRLMGITRIRSCQPISFTDFTKDAQAAGLEVVRWIAARPLISRRWYAVMRHRTVADALPAQKLAPFSDIALSLLTRAGICAAVIVMLMLVINLAIPKSQEPKSQFKQTVGNYVHDDDKLYFVADSELSEIASGVGVPMINEQLNIRDIIQKDKGINKDSLFLLSQQHKESIQEELGKELQFVKYIVLNKGRFALFSTEIDLVVTD